MTHRHPALDALLDGRLTGAPRRDALAHLDGCAECRAEYETMVLAERALAGDDLDQPSVIEREAMLRMVLAEVAPRREPRLALWFGLPAFAAASALLLVVLWPRNDGFVEKGRSGTTVPGARAFCVQHGQARQLTAAVPCPRGATLVASFKQPGSAGRQPTLCLVDAAGKVHTAAPGNAPPPGVGSDGEQVLDVYIDVDANVALGPATLYVIWCAQCDERGTAELLESARLGQRLDGIVQTIEVVIVEGAP